MRSRLERRYRVLLALLPGWYRVGRVEEMVAVFLAGRPDELDREYGRPGWGEAWATAVLAVRVRLAAGRRAGEVVRSVGVAGLVWRLVLGAQSAAVAVGFGGSWGWLWFGVVDVVAFAAVLAGRRGVARVAVGVGVVCGAVVPVLSGAAGVSVWWLVVWQVPVWVTAVAVVSGFHRECGPVGWVRWVWAAVVGVVAGFVWSWVVPLSVFSVQASWVIAAAAVVVARPWAGRAGVVARRV